MQEAQRGGTGRPYAHRYLLLQPLQTAAELGSPAAGQAGKDRGVSHGEARALPSPAPPLSPHGPVPMLLQRVVQRPAEETGVISTAATVHPPMHSSTAHLTLPTARRDGAGQRAA